MHFKAFSTKTLRIMHLTALFLLAASLAASATGLGQITLSEKGASLKKVLKEIKAQSGTSFFYDDAILEQSKPVDVHVQNVTLEQAMAAVFKDQPLTYEFISARLVAVKEKTAPTAGGVSPSNLGDTSPARPVTEVTGRVTNKAGEPIVDANVVVKRTGYGTETDANGRFRLKAEGIQPKDTLVVSYIGYRNLVIAVGNRTDFMLIMEVTDNELDKVVVQAYGKTSQRLTTSDIGRVTSEEIERQPVMNPLLALQGKVAGLDIVQTNGYASAPVKVELRGRSSINGAFTSDPLYIVDGVPLTVLDVAGMSNYQNGSTGFLQSGFGGPANGQSPLFSINPMDIESVEILKDADATSIYGSRGANGVILITTKKGKAGKTQLDIRMQEGISKVTKYWDMMNTPQYLSMRREALNNDGITPSLTHGDYDLLQWDTTRYTDWQKAIYGGTGKAIDAQMALSGGNAQTTFRIGAGYKNTKNILTVSGADQRGNVSLNLNHQTLDHRLNISLTSTYVITQSNMISLPGGAAILPPDAPAIYDSAGNLNYEGWGGANTSARNEYNFGSLLQPYTSRTNFLNSNLNVSYQVLKGLHLSSSFGYSDADASQQRYTPIASQDPATNPTGNAIWGYNRNTNWIIEPQAAYETFIRKGKISLLTGATVQETNTYGLNVTGSGYTSDDLIHAFANAPTTGTNDFQGEYRYAAFFSRATYNWNNKYLLNINARRDGSSRFGPNKQYGDFGSVGAAWIFSAEKWSQDVLRFLSFGKIKLSYGTTGSDGVGDYGYLTRWSPSIARSYNSSSTLTPTQLANPDFQWQVNKKLEAAIDLGILQDRISLSIDYYRDRCGNQLIQFPTPELSGFTSVIANSPALVQNDGWEFTTLAKIVKIRDFGFSLDFNLAINKNKLLAYPNIAQSPYASTLIVGQPLNLIQLFNYTGVDPQTGEYSFADKNHDGRIVYTPGHPYTDTYPYNLSPKFFGGLGANFNYKSLQLNIFFYYKKQIGVNALYQQGYTPGTIGNQPADLLGKEWQKPGDVSTYARFTTTGLMSINNFANSNAYYSDASFARLSNLSISYAFPELWARKAGMHECTIFVHANNLLIITKYKGLDPETQNFGGMPPSKTIVGGINFNF